jgi:molecular chaperone DnaK
MVKEAEAHAADDKKRKEGAEAKNHGDALVHSTEKALGEHGASVGAEDRTAIENAIANLKEALKADDADDIKAKTEELAKASMKLGEAMYKAQQAQTGEGAAPGADGEQPKDDNVVDAEFSEVDEDKKGAA